VTSLVIWILFKFNEKIYFVGAVHFSLSAISRSGSLFPFQFQ
jgi:hypothetical protein